ncbi:MAG: iron-sulfur cluster carrier protein ApbC [Steroidobacteraceae bacterium]
MPDIESRICAAVGQVNDPNLGCSFADAKRAIQVTSSKGQWSVNIVLGYPVGDQREGLIAAIAAAIAEAGVSEPVAIQLTPGIAAHAVQRGVERVPGISNIIAVASAKGGVGKSTVAVNLAIALARDGARVGLLDADIYGPSQPLMLGLQGERPSSDDGKMIEPLRAHGVAAMSIGFLVDNEQPMIWRGPMVTSALQQLLNQTRWGELDYLIVDLPPGTGDLQLTLAQKVAVAGAIIVTTPQDVALADARKGYRMFEKVGVPVLGIVENMSGYTCANCGHHEDIFGSRGGAEMAQKYQLPLLGQVPIDPRIGRLLDAGQPGVASEPASAHARAFVDIARRAAAHLSLRPIDRGRLFGKVVVEKG